MSQKTRNIISESEVVSVAQVIRICSVLWLVKYFTGKCILGNRKSLKTKQHFLSKDFIKARSCF